MRTLSPKRVLLALLALTAVLGQAVVAAPPTPLKLPSFESLAAKATESVNVTLDSQLLGIAAGFLDSDNPDDAATKELIRGLKGVYVRSYTFDTDFAYSSGDVESVRKQLSAPLWQQVVSVHNAKERTQVDIYLSVEQGRANGLAIIACEPRELTIVNIVGPIDLQKLHRLEGKFGIPRLPEAQK